MQEGLRKLQGMYEVNLGIGKLERRVEGKNCRRKDQCKAMTEAKTETYKKVLARA